MRGSLFVIIVSPMACIVKLFFFDTLQRQSLRIGIKHKSFTFLSSYF